MDEALQNMYDGLTAKLTAFRSEELPVIDTAKKSVQAVHESMKELRSYIISHPFESGAEEILFFKQDKPAFHSLLVFWIDVYDMEVNRPVGGAEIFETYNKVQLQKLNLNFSGHAAFYNYYRSGENFLDESYFLRKNKGLFLNDPHAIDNDHDFSTGYDFLVTRYLADNMLAEYIGNLRLDPVAKTKDIKSDLAWTASKAGLVEIIYAFQSGGVFNNGQAGIKEIAMIFEKFFGVELGNYYQVFNEIRLRKKGRAQLLDQLKKGLEGKMDELDER
jgi:RteC protein